LKRIRSLIVHPSELFVFQHLLKSFATALFLVVRHFRHWLSNLSLNWFELRRMHLAIVHRWEQFVFQHLLKSLASVVS
jgi:hypothetical protein